MEDPCRDSPDDPILPGIEKDFIAAPDIPAFLESIGPLGRKSRFLPCPQGNLSHHRSRFQQIFQRDGKDFPHFLTVQLQRHPRRQDPGKRINQRTGISVKIIQRAQDLDLLFRDSQFFPGFPESRRAERRIRFFSVSSWETDIPRLPAHRSRPDFKKDFPAMFSPAQRQEHRTFPQPEGPIHPLPLVFPKSSQLHPLFQFLTHRDPPSIFVSNITELYNIYQKW